MVKTNMADMEEKMRKMEEGDSEAHEYGTSPRIVLDFSGYQWKMERMRPGQGMKEGIHELPNELSGNDFSWNTAQVPGDVYTDLVNAGELEDPFFGRNMGKCKWVQDYEWWYHYAFHIPKEMHGKNLTLLFEGVDYSCDVWLNTHYLGHHEGMMSSFSYDVTRFADYSTPHVPTNLLTIKLDPPPKNQKNFAGMKHNFSGDYLTGVIPFGIWKPVKLIATSKVRICSHRLETKVEENKAVLSLDMEIEGLATETVDAQMKAVLSDGEKTFETVAKQKIYLGINHVMMNMEIENPRLWWPYDLGEPFLYDLTMQVQEKEEVLDILQEKAGLREITMQKNPGFTEEEVENPWTFVVNGKPIFLRSACWGGQPSFFYGRNNREKYQYFLEAAKECNINNLRIFGWHPAETEDFYEICDELGITVWTNFPYATQVFREDTVYLEQVKHEIGELVKDRRNHPSTIMWMGGEEVYFTEAHVKSGNRRLMEMAGAVTRSLTDTPYADASPLSSREGIRMGYKPKESAHANSHYYAAGAVFMEDYYPKMDYCIIPELTAASAPNVSSLKKFIPEQELWPMGLSWGYHAGDMHVLRNLNYEVFGDTCMDSLEHFVEATQIAQGTIFQYALEHFRRCKPHVSGVALCHFITNWPIIKWDLIDYYGERKKSFDFVKMCYQPLLPSLAFPKRRYLPGELFFAKLWIINDRYEKQEAMKFSARIFNKEGTCLKIQEFEAAIGENEAAVCGELSWTVEGKEGETFRVVLSLTDRNGRKMAENTYDILIMDQEKAKQEYWKLYQKMQEERKKYGRGYYRYAPEQLVTW